MYVRIHLPCMVYIHYIVLMPNIHVSGLSMQGRHRHIRERCHGMRGCGDRATWLNIADRHKHELCLCRSNPGKGLGLVQRPAGVPGFLSARERRALSGPSRELCVCVLWCSTKDTRWSEPATLAMLLPLWSDGRHAQVHDRTGLLVVGSAAASSVQAS
jgi:hypothetical protein